MTTGNTVNGFALIMGIVCLVGLISGWRPRGVSTDALFVALVLCLIALPLVFKFRE